MNVSTAIGQTSLFRRVWNNDMFSSLLIMGIRVGMLLAKFVLSIFMVRYMGLEELGIYGLIVATSATVQAVLRGGVFRLLSRDAVRQPRAELTGHLRHYGLGVTVLYVALAPVVWGIGLYFGAPALALLALAIFYTEHLSYDCFTLTNDLQFPKMANFLYSLQSAAWIYLFVILAFFEPSLRSLHTMFVFWICGGLVSLLFAAWFSRRWPWQQAFSQKLDPRWYREKLRRAFKLYLTEVAGILNYYMDRYIISLFLSLEMTGIYVFFSQILTATLNLVNSGVLAVYRPRLINAYDPVDMAKFNRVFRTCLKNTYLSSVMLALLAAVSVPLLIPFTDNPELSDHIYLLWALLAAMLVLIGGITAETGLYAMHKDKDNLRITSTMLLVTAVAGSTAVYMFGVYGIILNMVVIALITIAYAWSAWSKTDPVSVQG